MQQAIAHVGAAYFAFREQEEKCLSNIRLIYKWCGMDSFSEKIFFLFAACGVSDSSRQYIKGTYTE